jgi:hypothetical protein
MELMTEDRKRTIRDLMRQKISLEDQIQFESNQRRIQRLEDDLFEVCHSLDRLTNGVWFEDVDAQDLTAGKGVLN